MRSKTLGLLLACALASSASQGGPPAWNLKARINGVELVGEFELAQIRATQSAAAADQAVADAEFPVAAGASFNISVDLVNPQGTRQDVTGSPKLIYRPNGCLTISSNGQATVSAPPSSQWTCNSGDVIPLTIIHKDETADVAAMNMYLLKIE